ncbi:MAG TPA: efflux RND transporter periplasmic adaptor subunit [Pirellulales bacterium]|nr:efflux RND transporter periplasmic adaptor subunit [Pirellulales bacterium]
MAAINTSHRRGWVSWALAITLAGAATGLVAYTSLAQPGGAAPPPLPPHEAARASHDAARLKVKVVHATRGGLARTTTQPGIVHAFEYADLYAKASGYLTGQAVDIGDTVERGQVLAEIFDPERLEAVEEATAAVEQAKAEVQFAEARVAAAEAAVSAADALLSQRRAQVGRYTAARKFREKQYVRFIELARKRAVDERIADEKEQEYESALSAETEAEAAVKTAEADVARATAEVLREQAGLVAARASLRLKEATEKFAQIKADYLQITSPYNGVITKRNFHRGAFIRSADQGTTTPLLSVARTDRMRIVVYVRDIDVPYLDRGDQAVLRVDALQGEEFNGQVARFAEYEDPANRTMRTEIDLPNPTGKLREGMYGAVSVLLEPSSDNLSIPSAALQEHTERGEGTIYVVHGNVARKQQIRIGRDDALRTEVTGGLSEDDAVIVSYSGSLEDGEPVEAEPAGERSN